MLTFGPVNPGYSLLIGLIGFTLFRVFQPGIRRTNRANVSGIWCSALILCLLWHGSGIVEVISRLPQDSVTTLSNAKQFGLLVLSTCLMGCFFTLSHFKTLWIIGGNNVAIRGRHAVVVDLAATVGIFYLLVAFSPQVYYLYYLAVIDNLPWQWVVPRWLTTEQASYLSIGSARHGANNFTIAVTLWGALFAVLWTHVLLSKRHQSVLASVVFGVCLSSAHMGWQLLQ